MAEAKGTGEATTSASSTSASDLDPVIMEKTRSRGARRRSSSADSDPLEPLELALSSPDQEHAAREDASRSSSRSRPVSRARTGTSVGSAASRLPDFEIQFGTDEDSPKNPKDWPRWQRAWVIFCLSFSTWVIVLYSTNYTASIPGLMVEYGIENESIVTLGVTTYLLGLAVGSLVFAPLSELYGRRPVFLVAMALFTLLVIPAALATSLAEILVVRFFG